MSTTVVELPIAKLYDHPLEPKSRLDPKKNPGLHSMAESIKADRVHQPATVRPFKDGHQVLFGHRRKVSSTLAGKETLPCLIRDDLNDEQAAELLIVENAQREDMPVFDMAEQVKWLRDHGHSLDECAAKLGRSATWIHQMASISQLAKPWRKHALECLEDGAMRAYTQRALQDISRLPEDSQIQLWNWFGPWDRSHGAPRAEWISERVANLTRELKRAPWDLDDDTLVKKAGSCAGCPKRAGCQPELFDIEEAPESPKKDTCLDANCWASKADAYVKRAIAEAKAAGPGLLEVSERTDNWNFPKGKKLYDGPGGKIYQSCRKSEDGAATAIITKGDNAGRKVCVQLTKLKQDQYGGVTSMGSSSNETPKTSIEEKRKDLDRRRRKNALQRLQDALWTTRWDDEDEALDPVAATSELGLPWVMVYWAALESYGHRNPDPKALQEAFDAMKAPKAAENYLRSRLVDHIRGLACGRAHGYPEVADEEVATMLTDLLTGVDYAEHQQAAAEKYPEPASWSKKAPPKKKAAKKAKAKKKAPKKTAAKRKAKTKRKARAKAGAKSS